MPRLLCACGEVGIERDGAVVIAERLLELALIEQRDAEIAQRVRIIGVDLERAAAGGDRLVGAAGEAAHLAEIGVVERDVRLDGDGAAHVLDRLAELAGLMRDDAEHVHGLGVVRLRRRGAAGEFVGVGEEAVAALLLGERPAPGRATSPAPASTTGATARAASAAMIAGRPRGAALAFGLERRELRARRPAPAASSSARRAR